MGRGYENVKKGISKFTIIFLAGCYIFLTFWSMHFVTAYYDLKAADEKFTVFEFDKLTNSSLESIQKNTFNIDFKQHGKVIYKVCFIVSFAYFLGLAYYFTTRKNLMSGKEHGSAHWSSPRVIKKLMDKDFSKNVILTATEFMSLNMRKIRKNLNTLVVGGSGAGKTRFFLKPNVMQMNSSYVISDPKGEILRSTGKMLKDNGYRISVLNLVEMNNSDGYNPFNYLRENHDEDVMTLINTIITNTNPEPKNSAGDPFWEKSEMLLLQALFYYLIYEAPAYEQNIPMVMELVRAAEVKEDDPDYESDLDILFKELKAKDPNHIAVLQYEHFKIAAGKTAKSIIISVAARLGPYNIKAVANMSKSDALNLSTIGEEKTALFIIISPTNTTFNFIAAMMYTQLFAELDYIANWKHGGSLPIVVRFLLDEFANIGKIPNFEKILAYARSLGLGIVPIFQSISQLKEMYKDSWETIMDCCDSFLFLGGQGSGTLEYISKKLGFTTIDKRSTSRNRGKNSSSGENFDTLKRELKTHDEIGDMDDDECILFIKGKKFFSKKFDITKHKNYSLLEDYDEKNTYIHRGSVAAADEALYEIPEELEQSNESLLEESEKIMSVYESTLDKKENNEQPFVIKDLEILEEDVNDLEYEVDYENITDDDNTEVEETETNDLVQEGNTPPISNQRVFNI